MACQFAGLVRKYFGNFKNFPNISIVVTVISIITTIVNTLGLENKPVLRRKKTFTSVEFFFKFPACIILWVILQDTAF